VLRISLGLRLIVSFRCCPFFKHALKHQKIQSKILFCKSNFKECNTCRISKSPVIAFYVVIVSMFDRLLHDITGYATSLRVALLAAEKSFYGKGNSALFPRNREYDLDVIYLRLDKINSGFELSVSLYCHNPRKIDFNGNRVVIYKKSKMPNYDIAFGDVTKQVYDCAQEFRESTFILWWKTERVFDFDKIEWVERSDAN